MTTFKDIMDEVAGSMVDRMNRNFEMMDRLEYERPYTEAEIERCQDISNMMDQYWHDQYDLALSKAKGRYRKLLKLHKRDRSGECRGCDVSGYEGEPPEWPCRTAIMACKGTEYHQTQFVWPERPRRKHKDKYVTYPIIKRRTP